MTFSRLLDLTHPIRDRMPVFPGDPLVTVERLSTVEEKGYALERITLGSHTGTHLDAPAHAISGGKGAEALSLSSLIGPAVVLDFSGKGPDARLTVEDFVPHQARLLPGGRVLLRTDWSDRFGRPEFFTQFPSLTLDAAQWLIDRKIALLGMETPSLSTNQEEGTLLHRMLLGAGMILLESLNNLKQIETTEGELLVCPLLLSGCGGAPCRVFFRV